MRAVGWVRVRLLGAVSGRRLDEIASHMPVRRACLVRGGMEMDVRAADLNLLRHILRGAGLRLRIVRRYGMARVRPAARRQGALVLAALCALMVLWGLSQTVLGVTVTGAKDVDQQRQMRALLEEMGLKAGSWAAYVDREGIASEVMERFTGLTYAAVRRRGLTMELYVVQASQAPEVYDPDEPVNVVASCGGLVTRVVTLSGEALVRPGDTVVEGQVLIQGTERAAHARGAVSARVWAVGKGEAELVQRRETRTGRTETQSYLRIGSWRFPAEKESEFEAWQHEESSELALDGLFFPIELIQCTRWEVTVERETRDLEEAKQESAGRALRDALEKMPNGACVVDKRVEYSMIKDGKLCATVTLESAMQIGQERPAQGLAAETAP